jgi:hypothetical protein
MSTLATLRHKEKSQAAMLDASRTTGALLADRNAPASAVEQHATRLVRAQAALTETRAQLSATYARLGAAPLFNTTLKPPAPAARAPAAAQLESVLEAIGTQMSAQHTSMFGAPDDPTAPPGLAQKIAAFEKRRARAAAAAAADTGAAAAGTKRRAGSDAPEGRPAAGDALADEVAALNARLDAQRVAHRTVADSVRALTTRIEQSVREQAPAVVRAAALDEGRVQALEAMHKATQDMVDDLGEEVAALSVRDDEHRAWAARLGALHAQVTETTGRFAAQEQRARDALGQLAALEAALQAALDDDAVDPAAVARETDALLRARLAPLLARLRESVRAEVARAQTDAAGAKAQIERVLKLAQAVAKKAPNGGTQGH